MYCQASKNQSKKGCLTLDLFLIYIATICNLISIHHKVERLGVELLSTSEAKIGFETSIEDVLDIQYGLFKSIQKAELVLFSVIGVLMVLLPLSIVLMATSALLLLMTVFM